METRSKALLALFTLLVSDLAIFVAKIPLIKDYSSSAIAPGCLGLILVVSRNRAGFLNQHKLNFVSFHAACGILALLRYLHFWGTFDGYEILSFLMGGWLGYPFLLLLFRSETRSSTSQVGEK